MAALPPDFESQLERLRDLYARLQHENELLRRDKQVLQGVIERRAADALPRKEAAAELLRQIGETSDPLPEMAVIVAHPDDESVGAGGLLLRLRKARFLYATDGAPRDLEAAGVVGFATRQEYAAARRRERAAALALAGIDASQVEDLNIVDQEAALGLPGLTREIAARLDRWRPRAVITHPYEGGHPDHDAVAFAVHAACRLRAQRRDVPPVILETTFYHGRNGRLNVSQFLGNGDGQVVTIELNEARQLAKRQLFRCYASQFEIMNWFQLRRELFRAAPDYDFTQPPHEGPLLYEQFGLKITGEQFRSLAREAQLQLGVDG